MMKMKSIKVLATGLLASLLLTSQAWAVAFKVEREAKISKPAEDLKAIILDTDNTCATGCRYKLPSVREIKVVEKVSDELQYNWMYIDDVRDSQEYSEVQIKTLGQGHYEITTKTPTWEKIKELREKYSLTHNSFFDKIESVWVIKEVYDNGAFVHTEVSYVNRAQASGATARLFAKTIKNGMAASANQMMENLQL